MNFTQYFVVLVSVIVLVLTLKNLWALRLIKKEQDELKRQIPLQFEKHGFNAEDLEKKISIETKSQWFQILGNSATWLGISLALLGFFGVKGLDNLVEGKVEAVALQKLKNEFEKMDQQKHSILNEITVNDLIESELKDRTCYDRADTSTCGARVDECIHLVNGIDTLKSSERLSKNVDKFIKHVYNSGNHEDVIKFGSKLKRTHLLSYLSWANIGISGMNLYEIYGQKKYQSLVFRSADSALSKLVGYGTAHAMKLFTYGIDFVNQTRVKNEDVLNILDEVNSGSGRYSAQEAYEYLTVLNPSWNRYYIELKNNFPKEMAQMERYHMEASGVGKVMGDLIDKELKNQSCYTSLAQCDSLMDKIKHYVNLYSDTEKERVGQAGESEISPSQKLQEFLKHVFLAEGNSSLYRFSDSIKNSTLLNYSSWTYLGMASVKLYEQNKTQEYRIRAIQMADSVLKRVNDFGTAFAIKLLIQGIDLERGKTIDKEKTLSIFEKINGNKKDLTAHEAYTYLSKQGGEKGQYFDALIQSFSTEVMKMKEKHDRHEKKDQYSSSW